MLMRQGRDQEVKEVDVVTTGTMGIMSGTYAVLSFPIAPAGTYRRFTTATMNGVPVTVGPCPNESLGIIDVMVLGTAESEVDVRYGGSHLFRDLVERRSIEIEAVAKDGRTVRRSLDIDAIPTAKLMSTRNCFRNYRAFVNPSGSEFSSIFHAKPFPPNFAGITFSGCGHYNPVQNDPGLRRIGVGTKLLFNGAEGFAFSSGTRSSTKYPNLMTAADMKGMEPRLMGGYVTALGVECLASYAVPIPILDEQDLQNVMQNDSNIPLSIGDIRDRHKIGQSDYGQAWAGACGPTFRESGCVMCDPCTAAEGCPTDAIIRKGGRTGIDDCRCINCGVCTSSCPQDCFEMDLGGITAVVDGTQRTMPIICRNSNRDGAERTMSDLKNRMLGGTFRMTAKVSDIVI